MKDEFAVKSKFEQFNSVTNVPTYMSKKASKEKFKGNFSLTINHDLPMALKIGQYAKDPVSFHLHKKRNFIWKLKSEEKNSTAEKSERTSLERLKDLQAQERQAQEEKQSRALDHSPESAGRDMDKFVT